MGRPTRRPASARVYVGVAAAVIVVLVSPTHAEAHGPSTAIGRAVEALDRVPVSYEEGAAVSDIEAGNFPTIVGSNPKVAFMAGEAVSEITGGPNALAEEIAREAELDGTLVVLVGTQLGAWSEDIGDDRLGELVGEARSASGGGSPAAMVEALVRSVQAEPTGRGTPWALLAVIAGVVAAGAFVVYHSMERRRPEEEL